MKRMLMSVLVMVLAANQLFSGDSAVVDTNSVVLLLSDLIRASDSDCIGPESLSTNTMEGVPFRMSDLLSFNTNGQWSAEDNLNAVKWYLGQFADRTLGSVSEDEKDTVSVFLNFLADEKCGEFLPFAKKIIASNAIECRSDAWWAYLQLAEPSFENTDFIGDAFDSSLVNDSRTASEIHKTYAKKLMALDFVPNQSVITNAASMLYRTSTYFTTDENVDKLLLLSFPSYETSSNRLAYAMLAMSPPPEITFHLLAAYFAPITNRLLSVQGPLPEVEALK